MRKAVQQIMLGTVTGSEAQARQTLKRIRAAGYDGIELNRFMVHPSSLMIRMMTKAAGMPTGRGGGLDAFPHRADLPADRDHPPHLRAVPRL